MVFESVLTQVLNTVLGDYVENLDRDQLNVGIWGGDVELKNLQLKQTALNDLDLPIQALYGKIGKLVLKIPWKNLYGAAFVINVEEIYLVAAPLSQIKYNEEKEESKAVDLKNLQIKKVEEVKRKKAETEKPKADATFVEKLITQIIKNLQLNIKNIHIRYEDKITNPEKPFSLGVTLGELKVVSTDESWKPAITSQTITKIFKILELDSLALYWNPEAPSYSLLDISDLVTRLTKDIATKTHTPADYKYILGPINASARLRLNTKPEFDSPPYSTPKVHLNLDMEKLYIGITKEQYRDIIALVTSMDLMIKAEQYRKYRPDVPSYKGHYKEWWHFAYTCVVEDQVRRVRRNWDWNHIRRHRQDCKSYAIAYQNKIEGSSTGSLSKDIQDLERTLDIFNIVLIRQQVELEIEKLAKIKGKEPRKSWVGWLWGSSNKDQLSPEKPILKQFENAMTSEEKERMYEAIGYKEDASPTALPENYVDISASFLLRMLEIELIDESQKDGRVLFTELKGVKCQLRTRTGGNSIKVHAKIDEFTTYGLEQDDFLPNIITSETGGGDSALLEVSFETNPLDKLCDQRLHVTAQPLKIVYDAKTIVKVVDVFKLPPASSIDTLSAAAGNGLQNFKDMSATGLQHAIEQHNFIDINIDMHAPIILIPYGGKYTQVENVIVINLGNMKIHTIGRPDDASNVRKMFASGREKDDILNEMMEQSYDKFSINLTDLQVLLAQGGEDWKSCIKDSKVSDMHILTPITLNIDFWKCLFDDNPQLPLMKVKGKLPSINISTSDARLLVLYSLINSIPLPTADEDVINIYVNPDSISRSSSRMFKLLEMQDDTKDRKAKTISEDLLNDTKHLLTMIELKFVMEELLIVLYHQEDVSSPMTKITSICAQNLECECVIKTFVMYASVQLRNFTLQQFRDTDTINIFYTRSTEVPGEDYLFKVTFMKVDRKTPDFSTTYNNCEMLLGIDFANLGVNLHQEGLLSLIQYATQFQNDLEEISSSNIETCSRHSGSSLKRSISVLSGKLSLIDKVKESRKSPAVDKVTIKFQLTGKLKELIVDFSNNTCKISQCAVKGISSDIIIKDTDTKIVAHLQQIAIIDYNEESIHKVIMSVVGEEALSLTVILNNVQENEPDRPDIVIQATMGEIRLVFLNWFIMNMLNFINNFELARQAIIDASQAAADVAKQNVQEVYQKATKVSLNVNIKAPDIIVPTDSKSSRALLLDLGFITIKNEFVTLEVDSGANKRSALIDQMRVSLADLKLARVRLNNRGDAVNDRPILEPLNFRLSLKRNLSTSWYRVIPDVDISGSLGLIKVKVSQRDFSVIMSILSGNLAEGGEETAPSVGPKRSRSFVSGMPESFIQIFEQTSETKEDSSGHLMPAVYTTVRFTFTMEKLDAELLTAHYRLNTKSIKLARFSLEGLSVKGRLLSDNSFSTSMLLLNCLLDDMRPGREGKITRLIERTHVSDDSSPKNRSVAIRSMLDITVQTKKDELFADIRVFSFTVIISMEYLVKLGEFFTSAFGNQAKNDITTAKSTVSTKVTSTKSKGTTTTAPPSNTQMTINLKIEKPDIILLENIDDIDTSALMFNSEVSVKYRACRTHQVVNGEVTDFQLYTCTYNIKKRRETKTNVLYPVTISIAGSTPKDKGLHLELIFTDVRFSVSPSTIGLASNIMASMYKTQDELNSLQDELKYIDLWEVKPFKDQDFWFLKTEIGRDALQEIDQLECTTITTATTAVSLGFKTFLDELCLVSLPSITVTLEAGIGSKTLPMLLLESSFQGNIRNWSSQLSVDASLTLIMGYYNSRLAVWEPLIEPVEVFRNDKTHLVPWELKFEMNMNSQEDDSSMSPVELELIKDQPVMSIDIMTEMTMEVTITKSAVEVLSGLAGSFSKAMKDREVVTKHSISQWKFVNDIGSAVTLLLDQGSFKVHEGRSTEVILESGAEVHLKLKPNILIKEHFRLGDVLISKSYAVNNRFLFVKINDKDCLLELPVVRADERYFMLNYRDENNGSWGIISDIKVEEGVTIVTLRSILQVHNDFQVPIEIYYRTLKGNELQRIAIIAPGRSVNLPLNAVYTQTNEFFFAVEGYSITSDPFMWKNVKQNVTDSKILQCDPKNLADGSEPFTIKVMGEMEQVYYENTTRHTMASTCYNIRLRPTVVFKNCLPLPIVCCVENYLEELRINPGDILQLSNVNPGRSAIVIRLENYLDRLWSCRQEVLASFDEFVVWKLESHDSAAKTCLNLGVHTVQKNGSMEMALYCPFWMLNKTSLMIAYRNPEDSANTQIMHHPADFLGPILFSFSKKHFFSKKKVSVRVQGGEWSDKFSVDVAGSSGVICCKNEGRIFQIGVHNQLTYNGLTKQITFTPYYVITNNTFFPIEFQETIRPADSWGRVEPESCTCLWPHSELDDKLMRIRVAQTEDIAQPFLFTESHTTLLKLNNKYGAINVDIQVTEGGIYISLAAYAVGLAPALIVNHTRDAINFWEKKSALMKVVDSKSSMLYTWENPSGPRILMWETDHKNELDNDLRKDGVGEYKIAVDYKIYWVSFLDGMQRVLLLTEDHSIAENVQSAKDFEVVQQELTISLHGFGVSIINNYNRQDIMYIGITSSGIIWEQCKLTGRHFKQMNAKDSMHLENGYQTYLVKAQDMSSTGTVTLPNNMEVDYAINRLFKPNKRKIRRSYQTGLWIQQKSSPSQLQLHAKINRLQIDNQMYDNIFPVILAPVPVPKSVALDKGIKPFVELSIVQLLIKNSQIKQFKYFKFLVQEFHVKVDLGCINALLATLLTREYTQEEEKEQFLTDMKLVDEPLYSHVTTQVTQEQKSFYDLLHFSPLKIHVSFSMGAGSLEATAIPGLLNVLLQGVGVTVTELQDVVFKLAFFEREYTFLTQRQLISEASTHYIGQLVKQLYVLVLGLDVIGNPYGLVLGITKGVEDLFYEPFQGAIQGPGEFAEGLVLGVRSLFGHTVGGAAGAVSRITGAMGKGIAVLTFDDDYQRKRRDQIKKQPATVQEGFARSGKGLVMGVFDGVTGVFTKPISGAKEEGVGGFFKGLGKGAIGLVARPTSGVIDFASGSLDVVKRATDLGEDTTKRMRPPRFLQADGLVKPYNRLEAEGSRILNELDKSKYSTTDIYVYHYDIIKNKEVLMLTDQRLVYVMHNDMFGGWQAEWSLTWKEFIHPAKIVTKGILIPSSEKKKKFFSSNDNGKVVLIEDQSAREVICGLIESLRGTT